MLKWAYPPLTYILCQATDILTWREKLIAVHIDLSDLYLVFHMLQNLRKLNLTLLFTDSNDVLFNKKSDIFFLRIS